MAKKLKWGSFTQEDLVVNHEDDIYLDFLLLRMKKDGMGMDKARNFRFSKNNVRGTGKTDASKVVSLSGSFFYGWDRTSWPIPYVRKSEEKEAFDRRHTLSVLTGDKYVKKDIEVPDVEYERVYPPNEPNFNLFTMDSVLTIASMWGNVFGPQSDDTKDYNYVTATTLILKAELDRDIDWNSVNDSYILSRDFVERILKNMGCHTRYDNNSRVIGRIITSIIDAVEDPNSVANVLTKNNSADEKDSWVESSKDWGAHNTENNDYKFIHVPLQYNDSFAYTYAERILTSVCKNEIEIPEKITKVLLYNAKNANDSVKIVGSRKMFKDRLNSSWYTRRDNVLVPIEQIINPDLLSNYRKKLNELKLEVWYFPQLESETEPVEMVIDDGEPN